MNKKLIIFVTTMVVVFAMVTGVTVAYMTSLSNPVTNTFVTGDFGVVKLTETGDDGGTAHKYTIIPGCDINKRPQYSFTFSKDAIVTGAFVFVTMDPATAWKTTDDKKFIGEINGKDALEFTVNMSNWNGVFVQDGVYVYYKLLNGTTTNISTTSFFTVDSNGNTISVSTGLVEADCKAIMNNMSNYDITFKAYAIQKDGFAAGTTPTLAEAKAAYAAVYGAANG
jgi:hypothetical protein